MRVFASGISFMMDFGRPGYIKRIWPNNLFRLPPKMSTHLLRCTTKELLNHCMVGPNCVINGDTVEERDELTGDNEEILPSGILASFAYRPTPLFKCDTSNIMKSSICQNLEDFKATHFEIQIHLRNEDRSIDIGGIPDQEQACQCSVSP